jgi:hypothetical protein
LRVFDNTPDISVDPILLYYAGIIGFFVKNPVICFGLFTDNNIDRPGGFHTKKLCKQKPKPAFLTGFFSTAEKKRPGAYPSLYSRIFKVLG